MIDRRIFGPVLALGLALTACRREPPPQPPAPAGPTPEEIEAARQDSIRRAMMEEARRRAEEEARIRAEEERRERSRIARETLEAMVFFDFDKYNIRPDAQEVLQAKIGILRANPQVRIRLEGHADERGSTEYNLALGQRRAESVRRFFMSYGLEGDRFPTLSYGEERPLEPGHNEEAWAKNRRVEFIIIQGGGEITLPGKEGR